MKKYRVRVIYKAGFGATFDGEFLTEEEARRFLLDNVPGLGGGKKPPVGAMTIG